MQKRKKIIHLVSGLGVGGAETLLYRLLVLWAESKDFEHVVVSLRDNCQFDLASLGVRYRAFDMSLSGPVLKQSISLKRFLRLESPDLIHAWMYHGCIFSSLFANSNTPIVWGIHHSLHDIKNEKVSIQIIIKLCAYLSSRANLKKIIFVSKKSAAHHGDYGYSREKFVVIPNGFDCNAFVRSESVRQSIRADLGICEDDLLVGNFGRYHPVKNHPLLLHAFSKALKRHPKLKLLLVGSGLTRENDSIVKDIRQLNLQERVMLLGPRTDMPALYNALDLYVLSSKSEAFPNVLGEASATEVPCISTDVGDASIIIGRNGFLVPPEEVNELTDAIVKFFEMDTSSQREMGIAAKQSIEKNFSIQSIANEYLGVYSHSCDAMALQVSGI
jgi:glycosyltransferase involved in cell wall biosynthesis